jgi:PAS domain S-box-containing protein
MNDPDPTAERLSEEWRTLQDRLSSLIAATAEQLRGEAGRRPAGPRLRALIDAAADLLFVLDREGRYAAVFGRFLGKYGLEPGAFVGKTARELLGAEAAAPHEQAYRQALAGQRLVGDYEFALPSLPEPLHFRISLVTVRHGPGAAVGVLGVGRDVTEAKRREERAAQARKMEALARLAGGVAGVLTDLVTALRGPTELLRSRLGPDDPLAGPVEAIRAAADRAAALARPLLAVAGRQPLTPEVLDLNEVVAATADRLRPAPGGAVELVTNLDPGLGRVRADRGPIAQALAQLIANARDAMPHGGRLTLRTANLPPDAAAARLPAGLAPGPYVLLAVSDTGVGLGAGVRPHLFEPFFTTRAGAPGAGLGLATVSGIVRQSGGFIEASGHPGGGATFTIYLPQTPGAVPEAAPGGRAGVAPASPPGPSRETILVVEDEAALRPLFRTILEQGGYAVLVAAHGAEALRLHEQHPGRIDLLLTDVTMPGMTGPDLAERLSRLQPSLKVLYMSGAAAPADLPGGAGAAFLRKPFRPEALLAKVRELLAEGPASGE